MRLQSIAVASVAVAVLVAGCATTHDPGWQGTGATHFDAAQAECRAEAATLPRGQPRSTLQDVHGGPWLDARVYRGIGNEVLPTFRLNHPGTRDGSDGLRVYPDVDARTLRVDRC